MKRIDPKTFRGPSAYITDFDPIIFNFQENKEEYLKEVERRLKVTLLTKTTVVCAASHLANEFAYSFFKENPILLNENLVIPALRMDKEQIGDYFDDKKAKDPIKEKICNFYEKSLNKTVNWELYENANWFKKEILTALNDENSVLRRNLFDSSKLDIASLIKKIEKIDILRREDLIAETLNLSSVAKNTLVNFSIMTYHISGANVVNCESSLSQKNYIDYSVSDFTAHRTQLSDTQVFLKFYLELGLNTIHKNPVSVEQIDSLSFEDISELRKPIEKSSFQEKYDKLIQASIQSVETDVMGDNFINGINKSYKTFTEIRETYNDIFKSELPAYTKKKENQLTKQLGSDLIALSLNLSGFSTAFRIPSSIYSVYSSCKSGRGILTTLSHIYQNRTEQDYYKLQQNIRRKAIKELIKKSKISQDSPLLDVAEIINNSILEEKKV